MLFTPSFHLLIASYVMFLLYDFIRVSFFVCRMELEEVNLLPVSHEELNVCTMALRKTAPIEKKTLGFFGGLGWRALTTAVLMKGVLC